MVVPMTDTTPTEVFLGNVRADLGRRRMTVKDLAVMLDWRYEALIRRMNGTVALDFDDAYRIATALNLELPAAFPGGVTAA